MPALAKTWSTRPCRSSARRNSAVRSVQTDTSVRWKVKAAAAGSMAAEAGGSWMSAPTTEAPRERRSWTVARPMPDEAPALLESC